jgi:hypothetical protein
VFGWGKRKGCSTCWRVTHSGSYDWRSLLFNEERRALIYCCAECHTYWEIGESGACPISDAGADKLAMGASLPG